MRAIISILTAAAVLSHSGAVFADGTIESFFESSLIDLRDNISLEATFHADQKAEPIDETLGLRQYNFKLRQTLFQGQERVVYLLTNLRLHDLEGEVSSLPSAFYRMNFGLGYRSRLDNGWIFNGRGLFGSASDRLFANARTLEGGAIGTLSIPSGERDAWLIGLLLFYQHHKGDFSNRPLPQVAYLYFPNNQLTLIAGFPFSMITYRPSDQFTLSLDSILIRNINVRIGWKAVRLLHLLTGFESDSQRYNLSEKDDREFYYEKRVYAGILYFLTRAARLEALGGYAFDRFYFEGFDYGDRNQNRLDINAGLFTRAALKIFF